MKGLARKLRKNLLLDTAVCVFSLYVCHPSIVFAKDTVQTLMEKEDGETYTINFQNISVIEYIKFVSKITNVNFLFEEQDLQFTVTVVSEEPISVKNIMSTLVQVLRIHGLTLLEQENNLVVSRSANVNQISTVVSADLPESTTKNPPIVTRVFRLKNANPSSIAAMIRPMTSVGAVIEVSPETRQLIVMDVTTNVDKVAELLLSLDAPHSPLDWDTYQVQNVSPSELISLVKEIMTPFADGNSLILVPQLDRNMIYIVSTPHLIDRVQTILQDLDVPATGKIAGLGKGESVFLYKAQNQSPEVLQNSLKKMVSDLKKMNVPPETLINAINKMRLVAESESLLFTTDGNTIEKLKEILANLDVKQSAYLASHDLPTLYFYKMAPGNKGKLKKFLKEMADSLAEGVSPNKALIKCLEDAKWIDETNSYFFQGNDATISAVKDLLNTFQNKEGTGLLEGESGTFFLYELKNAPGDVVEKSLNNFKKHLENSTHPDPAVIETISNVKWIKENNSLLITGSVESVEQVKSLVARFDVETIEGAAEKRMLGNPTYLVYKVQNISAEKLMEMLKNVSKELSSNGAGDKDFQQAISSMKYVAENNTIFFTGYEKTLQKVQSLAQQFDVPSKQGISSFDFYQLKHVNGEKMQEELSKIAWRLKKSPENNSELVAAIEGVQWIKESNTLMLAGSPQVLDQLKTLIMQFDTEGGESSAKNVREKTSFFIYKPVNLTEKELKNSLIDMTKNLKSSGLTDPELLESLSTVQEVESSQSLLFTGTPETLEKVKSLLLTVDVHKAKGDSSFGAGKTRGADGLSKEKTSFFIYKPINMTEAELQASLALMSKDLKSSGLVDPELLEALTTVQKVEASQSLLFTGTPEALEKVKTLLATVDVRGNKQGAITKVDDTTFFIYQIQHVPGQQLMNSLKTLGLGLQTSNAADKEVAASINNMKWIQETNSLMFTGSPETLKKVQSFLMQFDHAGLAPKTGASPQTASPEVTRGPTEFIIYKPQYVSGDVLIGILQEFKANLIQTGVNEPGLFLSIDALRWISKTRTLLISGEKNSLTKIEELLKQFDVPSSANTEDANQDTFTQATNFLVFKLQYQKGDEIQSAVKKIGASLTATPNDAQQPLTEAINSLQWIEATNSLLASGDSESLQKIKHLIEDLDIPLNQVLIEVLIIQTSLQNGQSFGLEWAAQGKYKNRIASSMSNITEAGDPFSLGISGVNPKTGPTPGENIPLLSGFDLGVIGNTLFHKGQSFLTLSSLVNALQTDSDSTIIMNPKIVTQDNKSATVFVGQNIPFVGSVITSTVDSQTSTTSLEYRNIGTTLTVTPVLGENDLVSLDIVNEISQTDGTPPATQAGQVNGIITNQTTMNTRVHVPNEHFLILSGMIHDEQTHGKTGIPCLGGLPVVGAAFSSNTRGATKNNIIVFVRPHIIRSYDDYKKVTEHQENLYKDMIPLKEVKENFDRGVDLLKTYKDE